MINCKHKIIEGNTTKYLFCRAKNKTISDYECKACPLTLPDLPQGFEILFGGLKK